MTEVDDPTNDHPETGAPATQTKPARMKGNRTGRRGNDREPEQRGHIRIRWTTDQGGRLARGSHPAVDEDHEAIGKPHDLLQVVTHEDCRARKALQPIRKVIEQARPQGRVELRERLVEQGERSPKGEGPGEVHPLRFATRQVPGFPVEQRRYAGRLADLFDPTISLVARNSSQREGELQIPPDRPREEDRLLKGVGDRRTAICRRGNPVEAHGPTRRPPESGHEAKKTPDELGSRWGSGEIQITSVELLDDNGEAVTHPRTLEPLTIRVHLNAHAPIQDTVLVARIDEMNGHTVWLSSSRRNGVSIGMLDGPAEVTIEIPQLPLLEGTFDLTVAITNQTEIQPYDWWDRRVRFDVRQFTSLDSGITHIPSEWTITGAKNIVQLG